MITDLSTGEYQHRDDQGRIVLYAVNSSHGVLSLESPEKGLGGYGGWRSKKRTKPRIRWWIGVTGRAIWMNRTGSKHGRKRPASICKGLGDVRPETSTRRGAYISAAQSRQPCEVARKFVREELDQRDHILGHESPWGCVLFPSGRYIILVISYAHNVFIALKREAHIVTGALDSLSKGAVI
jgi:hypothetical protein